jgi:hypothetical protein
MSTHTIKFLDGEADLHKVPGDLLYIESIEFDYLDLTLGCVVLTIHDVVLKIPIQNCPVIGTNTISFPWYQYAAFESMDQYLPIFALTHSPVSIEADGLVPLRVTVTSRMLDLEKRRQYLASPIALTVKYTVQNGFVSNTKLEPSLVLDLL